MTVNIDQMRKVDFARTYGWHIQFPSFNGEFFPAHAVNDTFLTFQNGEREYGPWVYRFPEKATRGKLLDFEVYELSDYSLYYWLKEWKKDIQGPDYTTALLGEQGVARDLIVQRLALDQTPVDSERLMVIPDGDVSIPYSSDKGGAPLSVSFSVVVVGSDDE